MGGRTLYIVHCCGSEIIPIIKIEISLGYILCYNDPINITKKTLMLYFTFSSVPVQPIHKSLCAADTLYSAAVPLLLSVHIFPPLRQVQSSESSAFLVDPILKCAHIRIR